MRLSAAARCALADPSRAGFLAGVAIHPGSSRALRRAAGRALSAWSRGRPAPRSARRILSAFGPLSFS